MYTDKCDAAKPFQFLFCPSVYFKVLSSRVNYDALCSLNCFVLPSAFIFVYLLHCYYLFVTNHKKSYLMSVSQSYLDILGKIACMI